MKKILQDGTEYDMELKETNRINILKFFIYTYIWTWLFWLPSVLNDNSILSLHPAIPFFIGMPAVFGPTIVAFILTKKEKGGEGAKDLWKRGWNCNFKKKWLLSLLIIPITALISLLIVFLINQEPPDLSKLVNPLYIFIASLQIFFTGGPLGEEFGWRGYALDRLQQLNANSKWNAVKSSVILGFVWGLWHIPLFFMSGTAQSYIPFYQFMLQTIVLAVFYTWLYNNTNRSILMAMILHLVGNLASDLIPYWYTDLGRWIGFILQLLTIIVIIKIFGPNNMKKE